MHHTYSLHIRTLAGLEGVLAKELAELGAQNIERGNRLVTCQGDQAFLYRANLWCRSAIRILRTVASFPAADETTFYEGIQSVDWSKWMRPTGTLAVDAHVHSSFTTHSLYIAQLTKDAIVDQFRAASGERPSVELKAPDLRIAANLYQNEAQVWVDSSGESLHRRGYRIESGEAPLSETLAAGILRLSQWDFNQPLVDPFCGSGTFLIEAAMMARNIAPGLRRKRFGFENWSDFNSSLFETIKSEALGAQRESTVAPIVGVEIDPEVASIAKNNAERAGVGESVTIHTADFFSWEPSFETPGTLVLNPPYDERIQVKNIGAFYENIGDRLCQKFPSWKAHVFSANSEALRCVGLKPSRSLSLFNGALDCALNSYNLADPQKIRVAQPWRTEAPSQNPEWRNKAEALANRLKKNFKHLSKWARREGVTCWRVYNWDIPELPFLVDFYGDHLHFAEVPRNHDRSATEHAAFIEYLLTSAAQALGVSDSHAHYKERKPRRTGGASQVTEMLTADFLEVTENEHRFLVNFNDFLDVGLFLEHRKTRQLIQAEATGKDVLNLYSYTGAFSVYAAAGGARTTTTVDTARTYLEWALKNLQLNGFGGHKHSILRSDAIEFLERTPSRYDLVIVDPPTRSVNRASGEAFDVQEDHVRLLSLALEKTRAGGTVFFLTNSPRFQLDAAKVKDVHQVQIKEITAQTISPDFARKTTHRVWRLDL